MIDHEYDEDDEYDDEYDEDDEHDEYPHHQLDDEEEFSSANNQIKTLHANTNSLNILAQKLIAKEKSNIIINELVKIANKNNLDSYKPKRKKMERKKELAKNVKTFKELLSEKDNMNDVKYFKTEVKFENQKYLIDKLKKINDASTVDKPYRILLLESDIPQEFKIAALKKTSMMENMDPSVGEYFKLKNWVDTFMRLPFNKFNNLPFNFNDGLEKCNEYMESSIATLDSAVFGLNDAKMQIMQIIGQWIVNPDAVGSAIAIHGPMGTGKTSFVKEGISKILNRPFALIALGGATDSSLLEGHGYTYEGSTWGKDS